MKKFIYLIFIIISLYTNSCAIENKVNTIDINTQIQNSISQKKHLMLFFHINFCPYCKKMENTTLKDDFVQEELNKHFLTLDINTDKQNDKIVFNNITYTNKEYANKLDVHFFPTVLFLDNEGEIIYKVRGHRDIQTFINILEYMKQNLYEEMSFFEYSESLKNKE